MEMAALQLANLKLDSVLVIVRPTLTLESQSAKFVEMESYLELKFVMMEIQTIRMDAPMDA